VLGLHGSSLALAPMVLAALLLSGLVLVLRLWARILPRTSGRVASVVRTRG